jgi:CO/xanthine dehydrogenase Mo-binding subunit
MTGTGTLGTSLPRDDAAEKTSGRTRFTDDHPRPGVLHAVVLASPHARARIVAIRTEDALACPGVRGVFTGSDFAPLIGLYLGDKPALARGEVRYFGEGVAAVVADDEASAARAVHRIEVDYEILPPVRSPREALAAGAPVLHPDLASYRRIGAIVPEPGTNVANRTKIRKGDAEAAFRSATVTVEGWFSFPPGDHAAMEPRAVEAEVRADGRLLIRSSSQSPFGVRTLLAQAFGLAEGDIEVIAGPVGGGFGGKAGIQLEPLAYLLSKALGGRAVRLVNSREADMLTSPGRPGLEARVALASGADGTLMAIDLEFLFDSGGYADYAVNVSRAAGYACTGPYRVPNVKADSLCVYTNHPFATAYRGFGHIELSFAVERALDLLAAKLGMDPAELRLKNAVRPGDTVPSGAVLDPNTGDLPGCLRQVMRRLEWANGTRTEVTGTDGRRKVRAKGVACFWKAPAIPTFTDAGAVLQFREDASVSVATGVVELGQGTFTGLRQIVAEALKMDPAKVRVVTEVNTDRSPHDWGTAASRSIFMVGRAALEAVADAVAQIKRTASGPLRCPEDDLEVAGGRVFLKDDPATGLDLSRVVLGYVYPDGMTVGGPVIGRGRYVARHLTGLDPETGAGRPGLEWTLGAEGVEVEVDPEDGTYRFLKAACCMDVGRVLNPDLARGQVVGAMAMGLGFATSEGYVFDGAERVMNGNLRDYKLLRFGEQPEYLVDFLETPQGDGPFGARGLGEQGIIGMPNAVAAALSRAVGSPFSRLPITPEAVWKALKGGQP